MLQHEKTSWSARALFSAKKKREETPSASSYGRINRIKSIFAKTKPPSQVARHKRVTTIPLQSTNPTTSYGRSPPFKTRFDLPESVPSGTEIVLPTKEPMHVGKLVAVNSRGHAIEWESHLPLAGVVKERLDDGASVRVVVCGLAPYAPASRELFVPGQRVMADRERAIPTLLDDGVSGDPGFIGLALTPHMFHLCTFPTFSSTK